MKCHPVAGITDFRVVPAATVSALLHPKVHVRLLMQTEKVSLWHSVHRRRCQHGVHRGIAVKQLITVWITVPQASQTLLKDSKVDQRKPRLQTSPETPRTSCSAE